MNFKYFLYCLFLMVAMTLFLVLSYFQSTTSTSALSPQDPLITIQSPIGAADKGSLSPPKIEVTHPLTIPKKKIAYAITITKDGPFLDGALVLGYSAQLAQQNSSKYSAELVAFVTPEVVKARVVLAKYGWKILEKNLPVELHEIQNEDYMNRMKNSGCCGASEFLKLWAYTLIEYHRVVHLDMDTVIYENMDELYEIDKELLYTGDYGMKGGSPVPPVQGGLLIIRPSVERFEEMRSIIRIGDFGGKGRGGWGGSGIGNFWGGQTIQGILAYYYHSVHPGDGYELNRCIYNCMVDNPYRAGTTVCLDGQPTCEDCRLQHIENVKEAHFTICQKPWTCCFHNNPRNQVLCSALHDKWFMIRDEFERSLHLDTSYRMRDSRYKASFGMCKGYGDDKYIPIPIPHTV